mgnify:CR=1 FL=1
MLCEHCKQREATIHYEHSRNGKKESHDLCQLCFMEVGGTQSGFSFFTQKGIPNANDLMKVFLGMQDLATKQEPKTIEDPEEVVCPQCGTRWSDFQKNGLLGCPHCYQAFAQHLSGLLRKLHGHSAHIGKRPEMPINLSAEAQEGFDLRKQLKIAIQEEDYEKAALLRDKIKALDLDIKGGEGDAD